MMSQSSDCCESFVHMQVITGYLLAGSIIGPGGLNFISEMVQVCYVFDLKRFVCVCSFQELLVTRFLLRS